MRINGTANRSHFFGDLPRCAALGAVGQQRGGGFGKSAQPCRIESRPSLEGQPLIIHVSLTDGTGRFTPQPTAAVMVLANVEKGIKAQVDRQTASDSTVSCGSHKVLVKAPGATFPCTVVTSTVSRTVEVTVKDVQGTFQFEQTGPVTTAPSSAP